MTGAPRQISRDPAKAGTGYQDEPGTPESRQKRLERGYAKWVSVGSQQILNSPG